MPSNLTTIIGALVVCLIALGVIALICVRLYVRSSKERSFVRTGFGGQKVIMNGGALCIPILQEIISVNMNTLRLPVNRANDQALITRDRMRVDVVAEFYVRVQPSMEAIANAAQTLGNKTTRPEELKNLVEGKFVDALRSVAAEMSMVELHEKRVDFVQKVQQVVTEDLLKNGLELESVSLTGLDQTSKEYFNPNNAFDAEGLTRLTEEIERRKKIRNDIEQDTAVEIENKNLEAAQKKLQIRREEEYARLQQEKEIAVRKAEQDAEIQKEQADQRRDAEQSKIAAEQKVQQSKITAERAVEEERISKERILATQNVEKQKSIELANQEREIAVAEKSKEQSIAKAEADEARATAIAAEEKVTTAKEREIAERQKQIELIDAAKKAEREAIAVKVSAEAEKVSAADRAEAVRLEAKGRGDHLRITAEAEAAAEKLKAEAAEVRYAVEAAGKEAINKASNTLSVDQIAMQVKLKTIEHLEEIVAASVRPLERIEGIKIVQVGGLPGVAGTSGEGGKGGSGGSLADQVVESALRYRAQAPLLDSLLKEVGIDGTDMRRLMESDKPEAKEEE